MGQALFLLAFAALVAVATAWGADDLRHRSQVSELAELVIKLLAFLGVLVFVLANAGGTWPLGIPAYLRVPAGAALIGGGVLLAARPAWAAGRWLPLRDHVGDVLFLVALGASVLTQSIAALVVIAIATLSARVLLQAASRRGAAPRRTHRWAPTPAADGPADVE